MYVCIARVIILCEVKLRYNGLLGTVSKVHYVQTRLQRLTRYMYWQHIISLQFYRCCVCLIVFYFVYFTLNKCQQNEWCSANNHSCEHEQEDYSQCIYAARQYGLSMSQLPAGGDCLFTEGTNDTMWKLMLSDHWPLGLYQQFIADLVDGRVISVITLQRQLFSRHGYRPHTILVPARLPS